MIAVLLDYPIFVNEIVSWNKVILKGLEQKAILNCQLNWTKQIISYVCLALL
jgi:hypothetical protein